ncbi:MAG: TetR family transcriptional regulator [Actinophytocola sp.]|nr:TetR family transcriptional regulator [Actinophytocola sp.]
MSEVKRPPRSEVRERILDAARKTFAADGFAGATIDAIAAAAGFTKGAVYSNFGSKDELFLALLDQQIQRRAELLANVSSAPSADAGTMATAVGDALMQAVRDNLDYHVLFLEYLLRATRDPAVRKKFVDHRRAVLAQARDAVKANWEPSTNLPIESVAQLVVALTNGFAIEEIVAPGSVPAHLIADVLKPLAGNNRDPRRR